MGMPPNTRRVLPRVGKLPRVRVTEGEYSPLVPLVLCTTVTLGYTSAVKVTLSPVREGFSLLDR
jgi:hypothetical protein